MAVTATPAFVQSVKMAQAIVTGATTDRTSPNTNTVLLWTAGGDGSVITSIWAINRTTVTASELQLYLSTDDGTTRTLMDSALMAAHTVANTTAVPRVTFTKYSETSPLYLPASARIYAGSAVALAGGIIFSAIGGDL